LLGSMSPTPPSRSLNIPAAAPRSGGNVASVSSDEFLSHTSSHESRKFGLSVSPVIIDHNDWTLMAARAPPTPVAEGEHGVEFDEGEASASDQTASPASGRLLRQACALLVGESVEHIAEDVQWERPYEGSRGGVIGELHLTDFRVGWCRQPSLDGRHNYEAGVPLRSISQLYEEDGGATLRVRAKHGRMLRFRFADVATGRAFRQKLLESHRPLFFERQRQQAPDHFDSGKADFERQGVPWTQWRICRANSRYDVCSSYPADALVVPAAVSDDDVRAAAQFRTRQRLPCLVYYDRWTGASLCRASQPLVGVGSHRNSKDENLLRAIYDNNTNGTELRIVDCRSRMAALGNKLAHGAGVESRDHGYETCHVEHQDMPNIHAVSASFAQLTELCSSGTHRAAAASKPSWLKDLESTGWFEQLGYLLAAAERLVVAMGVDRISCLVHCSDGWDRTTQLVSLAALLLDPYYRTIAGFSVLVEREWVRMGHQFSERSGHRIYSSHVGVGSAVTEQKDVSPIFVQWLDAVWQVMRQFPTAFEFNEDLLVLLGSEVYSCRFRTFAFDCEMQRRQHTAELAPAIASDVSGPGADGCRPALGRGSSGVQVDRSSRGGEAGGATASVVAATLAAEPEDEMVGESIWEHIAAHEQQYASPFFTRNAVVGGGTSPESHHLLGSCHGNFGSSGGDGGRVLLHPSSSAASIRLWSAMYLPDDCCADAPIAMRPNDALTAWARRAVAEANRGAGARAALAESTARVAALEQQLADAHARIAAAAAAASLESAAMQAARAKVMVGGRGSEHPPGESNTRSAAAGTSAPAVAKLRSESSAISFGEGSAN
jgi:myotubularin-related protein 1/2